MMSIIEDKAERFFDRVKKEGFIILVWGPGKPSKNATKEQRKPYNKRIDIKKTLDREFNEAEVYFSEDKLPKKITSWMEGPDLSKEAVHAALADVIIILDISRGADLEVDHFIPTYPWFRDKTRLFIKKEYMHTKGLVKDVYGMLPSNNVEGFTEEEFDSCQVATEKAIRVAKEVAVGLLLKGP